MPTDSLIGTADTSQLASSVGAILEAPVSRKRHINWALKALPVAAVLVNGLLLFVLVSSSLAGREVM